MPRPVPAAAVALVRSAGAPRSGLLGRFWDRLRRLVRPRRRKAGKSPNIYPLY